MSLIQQALEKTGRIQAALKKAGTSQPWKSDLTGEKLEKELTQVQEKYARQRKSFRKIALGVAGIFLIGLFFLLANRTETHKSYVSSPAAPSGSVSAPATIMKRAAIAGYRLTGITNFGEKTMAVINGEIVGIGETVSGAVVTDIQDKEVRLNARGREIRLNL